MEQIDFDKLNEESEERNCILADKARESFLEQLRKLSHEDQIYLLSSLEIVLEYASRDESWEYLIKRFADYASAYGQMMLGSWQMRFSSLENPRGYLLFLKYHQQCMDVTEEQRKLLIEQAIDFLEDSSKLKKLIEGEK